MSTVLSNKSLEEAEAAIKSSQSYHASKGEQTLNVIGSKILAVSNSQHASMAKAVISSAEFHLVKDQMSNFIENSKILVGVLDEVGKAHPFIQAAVVIFKAAIQLELTRRENDERVLALNITMCDMMSVLRILQKVARPKEPASDGPTIEERLQARMVEVVESIKSCAELCDSYQRRHATIKFFTSFKWQSRFSGVAEQFVIHQKAIQSELQIYVSIEVTNTSIMISTLNQNVTAMMKMVFENTQPPEEREIANFVRGRGGDPAAPDDELLKDIIKNQQRMKQTGETAPTKGGQRQDFPRDLNKLKEELNKDVDAILLDNRKVFTRAFDAIEIRLKEVKVTIVREGDRVIETILAGVNKGAHERIVDRDIYYIWQDMGWKGSVKATHLVMAVHDHFSAKTNTALDEIRAIAKKAKPASAEESLKDIESITERAIPATPSEDLWALRYITVHRAQSLVDALDEDGSSFITVKEVNAFTTTRPDGWSLPRWIAYWTFGFEMTTQWYYRRICRFFSLLSESSKGVLPANRKVVDKFTGCWSIETTQDILSGLRDIDYWDGVDWGNDSVFRKFKDWVLDSEKTMDTVLRSLVYYIDQDNTLNTVTGGGRPEKYMMPLFCLLLKRALSVMEKAHDVVLHPEELDIIDDSLSTLLGAVYDRAEKLQAIYKLQNIKKEEKLQNIFFGLYAHFLENPKKGDFWKRDFHQYDWIIDEPPTASDTPDPEPYFGPQTEELDLDTDLRNDSAPNAPANNVIQAELMDASQAPRSLVGAWSGTYSVDSVRSSDGPVSFSITQHTPDDRFECSGVDAWGPFTVNGRLTEGRIVFLKVYQESQKGVKVAWRYEGLLNQDVDEISGSWGKPLGDENEFFADGNRSNTQKELEREEEAEENVHGKDADSTVPLIGIEPPTPNDDLEEEGATVADGLSESGSALTSVFTDASGTWRPLGTFILYRRPVDYGLYRPSDEEFRENKPRALWKMVRKAAKYWFQKRHLTWEGIRERRDKRQMYLKLWEKKSEFEGTFADPADALKWEELVSTVHPSDLHLWQTLAQFRSRREPVQLGVFCDHCDDELQSTRLVCIECSEGENLHTLDLCPACQADSVYVKTDSKDHNPSHPMIQLRRAIFRIELNPLLSHAKSCLSRLTSSSSTCLLIRPAHLLRPITTNPPEEPDMHCLVCNNELSERPYWYCIECDEAMCVECNNRSEEEKPWLQQRKIMFNHDWLHTMVLHAQTVAKTEPQQSTDERLVKLEARLEARLDKQEEESRAFESTVSVRLQKVEELLERLLVAVTPAMS